MTKSKYTVKTIYAISAIVIILMLFLQLLILNVNSVAEAKSTTAAYLIQAETVIEKNKQEEQALLASLKKDYIVLAKAVSYYLDHNPGAVNNANELKKICSLMSIDEIYVFDKTGTITSGTTPEHIGITLNSGEQIAYFLPMLSDTSLSMCQDIVPNTAEGRPMVYAMTWNESGTQMVQVGIEPVRLLEELKANEIQETVDDIVLDEHMSIVVADASSLEVVASKNPEHIGKDLREITDLNPSVEQQGFSYSTKLGDTSGNHFCSTAFTEDYCVCIFLRHSSFFARIAESILAVFIYLLIAFFVITTVIKRLISTREENYQHLLVFQSMSEIYYSLHLVDLKKNTVMEYSSRNQVKNVFDKDETQKANELMTGIMHATMSDEYLERGLEFGNMATVAERMRGKKIISMELLGKNVGWIRMSFIAVETEDDVPVKIIVATQVIDEEKRTAESLYKKSHVDELTGCPNRRAYNADVLPYEDSLDGDLVYMSLDVNGLKTVNDDIGHEAGDELICGAAKCMMDAFAKHGKIYRVGGDEFIGLLHADKELQEALCCDFDERIESWHGTLVSSVSVSYGCVRTDESEGLSLAEIAHLADQRMYESKAEYYRKKGIERRRT